ncbi:MAG TPA: response regulator [Deferrimonas sp.]|jgi:CheY-like chemotaxis protein
MVSQQILVVDHAKDRRDHLRRLLTDRGIETLEAASCEEGLAIVAAVPVNLVLTETELPAKSGLYLLKKIKEHRPDIEVILITHNASSYNVLQALRNGAYDFIVRPIDTGEILYNALDRVFSHIQLRHDNAALISELEKNNLALTRNLKMMKALNDSIERLATAIDIEDLFMELLTSAVDEVQARRGFLALFDRATGNLALKVSQGIPIALCRQYANGLPEGLTTEIARQGKPVLVAGNLPEHLDALAGSTERNGLLELPGLLAAPLLLKKRVVGIVVLSGHGSSQRFGEQELHFLIQLSHHAALALEKAGIIHQLKRGKGQPSGGA